MKDKNYQNLLDNLYEGVYYVDLNRKIKYWSKGAEHITGYKSEEMIGRYCNHNLLSHTSLEGDPLCETGCLMRQSLTTGTYCKTEVFLKHKKGHRIHVSVRIAPMYDTKGNIIGATQVFTNNEFYLTQKGVNTDESYALYYDKLTKLPTQFNMKQKIKTKIQEFRRYGWNFGLILLELDDYVEYKRKLSHSELDDLIVSLAKYLRKDLRPFDTVSHWQSNQFMVMIINIKPEYLRVVAERLSNSAKKKGLHQIKKNADITFSVGAAMTTEGISIEELLEKVNKLKNKGREQGGDKISTSLK